MLDKNCQKFCGQICVPIITDDTKIEYAIGVGVASHLVSSLGYKSIETIDIIEDILYGNKGYDSNQLIENTFPKMLKVMDTSPSSNISEKKIYLRKWESCQQRHRQN